MPNYTATTAEAARKALERLVAATYAEARAYYDGDHWQGADGWIGVQPYNAGDERASVEALIEAGFVSANKVREIVRRHVAGVVGREPAWRLTVRRPLADAEEPAGQEQALIDEGEAALTVWWNRVLGGVPDADDAGTVLEQAVTGALLARQALLRLYVPERPAAEEAGADRLAAALARIDLEAVPPDRGALVRDPATALPVGIVSVPAVVDIFAESEATDGPVELHYLDDAGNTVLQVIDGEAPDWGGPFAFGGRLLVAPVTVPPLVTPQVMRLQQAYNHSLTMLQRNSDVAGSVERLLLNAQKPGTWARNDAGEWEFTAAEYRTGAGTSNFMVGLPIYGDPTQPDRVTGYTNPSVAWRDPVPVDSFVGTQDALYAAMLAEAGQRHALIAGDATASGESRKQARAEFTESLRPTARAVEAALRGILEAALALAAEFAGQGGRYASLRADVTCLIDAGPLTGDEQREIRDQQGAGLLSTETAMGRLGVDDVDAEQERIAMEREAKAPRTGVTQPLRAQDAAQELEAIEARAQQEREAEEVEV
jgi:hypothetical protein